MKPWLVRLGLSLVLLGFAGCSGSDNKGPQGKPDPSAKPEKPPTPPPIPKTPPTKPRM